MTNALTYTVCVEMRAADVMLCDRRYKYKYLLAHLAEQLRNSHIVDVTMYRMRETNFGELLGQ